MGGAVESFKGREALQSDLDKFVGWAITNCMKFLIQASAGFCTWNRVSLGDKRLESSPVKRDLRILVGSKLNMSQQCTLAVQRANCGAGLGATM